MRDLTERQTDVLLYVIDEAEDTGFMPTLDQIKENFGWSSQNAAADHVNKLIDKGWLRRRGAQLSIVGACPVCRRPHA